jgi:hydrogenase expression/formation protein HypD
VKHLSEYRDAGLVRQLLERIARSTRGHWRIMEVCGGQTHSLVRHGLLELLPAEVQMIHGPGCPVCVTPEKLIDQAIALAQNPRVVLCTFGDMLRVPGTGLSLQQAKARGADVRVLYSPLDALAIAEQEPGREVVFFAVGFETTAPAHALAVLEAERRKLHNFSLLSALVLVPPAIASIMEDPDCRVHGFLAPGHVCTVVGTRAYAGLAERYRVPIVVTGFEPVDLLEGILAVVEQLERGEHRLENRYRRVVREDGNSASLRALETVYAVRARQWRGLGAIAESGLELRPAYRTYDAALRFGLEGDAQPAASSTEASQTLPANPAALPPSADTGSPCLSGEIMKGKLIPPQCPHFGSTCNPEHPLGAPMVSSEGACAAYYQHLQPA